jgi:sugar transferase (PEP-CTERM/EpsH1 system associated)
VTVLYLTHRLPFAPNRGDRIRAYYTIRELSKQADVALFSLVHDAEERDRAENVPFVSAQRTVAVTKTRNWINGIARLPTSVPLTHSLLDAGGLQESLAQFVDAVRPDAVLAYCSGMARLCFTPPLEKIPFVLDMVDVDSQKWTDLASRSGVLRRFVYAREARTLMAFERRATLAARRTFVVNDRERDTLRRIAPDADIEVSGNGIDLEAFARPDGIESTRKIIFCGVLDYQPNADGVIWFLRNVWPAVQQEVPDAEFEIVGSGEPGAIAAAAQGRAGVRIVGQVPEVQPRLWRAAVSVAPLLVARGIQNKVLEALAAGLPTVVTSPVWDGLPPGVRPGCMRASEPADFAEAVVRTLRSTPAERLAYARQAGLANLGWTSQLSGLIRGLQVCSPIGR